MDNSITKIDSNTIKIYFHGVLYILAKDDIQKCIDSEYEWLNILLEAKRLMRPENLHNKHWTCAYTQIPSFDNYDIT